MGLAASQARLLSLTARLSNSEFEIQSNLNQKARLSGSADGITREYENSLNLKKMTMQVYDQNGSSQVDLSYRALTNYVKDSLDNPPYIVTDDKNRAVITADMLNAYQIYTKDKFANVGLDALLKAWNDAKKATVEAESNVGVVAVEGDKWVISETQRADELRQSRIENLGPAKDTFEADKAAVKAAFEKMTNTIGSMDRPAFDKYIQGVDGQNTAHSTDKNDLNNYAAGMMKQLCEFYSAGSPLGDVYEVVDMNSYTYNFIKADGSKLEFSLPPNVTSGCVAQSNHTNPYVVGAMDLWKSNYTYFMDAYNSGGTDAEKQAKVLDALTNFDTIYAQKEAEVTDAWNAALLKAYGADKLNNADHLPDGTLDDLKYDIDKAASGKGDGVGGSEWDYLNAKDLYEKREEERTTIITNAENKRDQDNIDAQENLVIKRQEEEAAKKAYEDALNGRYDGLTDAEVALLNKYDPNLYEKMSRDGYNLNYQHDLDKTKWFQEQLRAGKLFIQRFDKNAFEGKSGYVDDSWQTGTVPVSEVQDYEGRAEIKAKYDREMEKLQKVDKSFDLNIKKLESEHQALEIEYESVKKVIDKNVESSFKTFG